MSGASSGRRVASIAMLVIAVIAGVLLTLLATLFYGFHCTDGDGGYPYVARDSAQKDVCNATGDGWVLLVAMLALCGLAAFLARGKLAEWRAGATSLLVAVVVCVGVAASPLIAFIPANLPSDACSATEQRAVEEFRASGGVGEPPFDCDTY